MVQACFRPHANGLDLFVRLTPGASGDRIGSIETSADGRSHLRAKVRAVPEKGAANEALTRLVGSWLDVPRSSVSIVAGSTSRLKTVRIIGDPGALAGSCAERVAAFVRSP